MRKRKLDQTTLNAQNILNKPTTPAGYINHPLYTAIMSGDIEKVKTLCNNVADFDSIKTQYGTTPLHWAAQYGNPQIAQVLLEAGSKLDIKDRNDTTPAEIAVAHRHMALATMFINYTGDNIPFNMLHTAAAEGNAKQTNWLLAYGADPKILTYDQHKLSALNLAGKNNNKKNIEALAKVSTFKELYAEKDVQSLNLVPIPGYQTGKDMKSIGYKALQNNSLLENINNNSITHLTLKIENAQNTQKIMRALETNYSVTHLTLERQKWSIQTKQAFTKLLELSKSIVHLTIDDWALNEHHTETLAKALKINTSITRLDFSGGVINPEILPLLEVIKESNSIVHLDIRHISLSHIIARAIAEIIEKNTSLTHLDLINRAMDIEVIKIISSMLAKNTSLTHLGLENTPGLVHYYATPLKQELIKIISEVIEKNTSLTYLMLAGQEFIGKRAIIESLKHNTSLTHIHFTHPGGDDGILAMVQVIEKNIYLSCLSLERYSIYREEAIAIAEAIKVNHSLTHLNLRNNGIEVKGAVAIAEALKVNHSLTHLNLGYNHINAEGAVAIAEAIKVNHSLTHLNLGYNQIEGEGAIAIADAIEQNMCLSYLNLAGNVIKTDGAIAIAKSLQKNSSLTFLDLASNYIDVRGIIVIALAIQHNMFLSFLSLAENDSQLLGAIALAESIKVNHSLTHLDISRNPMKFKGVNVIALALDHNKFITTLKSEADTNMRIKNDYIAYRTSMNESLVHKLSSFLLNKFGITEKQPPIKVEDLHYFKFYQKANQELLNECLQANYRTQTNNSKIMAKQIHNVYIKLNKFINDHYLHLTTVCKDNILAPDCPQDISSHIFSFLGKQSLWIKYDPTPPPPPVPVEALEYIPIELFEQRVSGAQALEEESVWRWE